jgi:hypothetical protein
MIFNFDQPPKRGNSAPSPALWIFGPKLWPCGVGVLLGRVVPFWRGVVALYNAQRDNQNVKSLM